MWFPPASLHKFHGPAHRTLPPLQHCCQQSRQYPCVWRVELPHTLLCLAFQASFPRGKTFAYMQTSWTSLLPTAIDSPFSALHWICCVKSHQWSLNRNTMFSFSLQCHWPLLHWPLLSSYIYPQLAYTAKPFGSPVSLTFLLNIFCSFPLCARLWILQLVEFCLWPTCTFTPHNPMSVTWLPPMPIHALISSRMLSPIQIFLPCWRTQYLPA